MNKNTITAAIKERLSTLGINTAWPNVEHDGVTPYLEFTFATARREDPSLEGGTIMRELGVFQVAVAVDVNTGTAEAENMADMVADLFPKGQVLTAAGGRMKINAPPQIAEGFIAGVEWRVPVLCGYEAVRD